MCIVEVFTTCTFFFPQVRNGIGPETVDTQILPVKQVLAHHKQHFRVAVVPVGLKVEKPVKIIPFIAVGFPVAVFNTFKQQAGITIEGGVFAPDEIITMRTLY